MPVRKKGGTNRIAGILIDGSNLHATTRMLGFNIDYRKLINSFEGIVFRVNYFTALPPATEQSTLRPLVDYLDFNGFTVIRKEYKEFDTVNKFMCDECGKPNIQYGSKTKGNMDIEIAVMALEMAPYVDDIYLFSGDGDFRFLVEALQRWHGVRVTVVSTIKTSPRMCAEDLRRQADDFIDIAEMRELWLRDEGKRGLQVMGD